LWAIKNQPRQSGEASSECRAALLSARALNPNPGLTRAPAQVVGALQATAEPRTSLSRSAPTVDLTRLNFTLWYPLQPGVGSPRLRLTWQHSDPRAVLLLAHTHLKLERTVFEAGAEFIQGFSREVGGGVVGVNRGRFQHTGAGTSSVLYCMRYRHSMPNPPHQMHHTVSNTNIYWCTVRSFSTHGKESAIPKKLDH
jgi:hypothetical protein